MPSLPSKPCARPGCRNLAARGGSYCDDHEREVQQRRDEKRGTAAQRGYDRKWRKASQGYLARHPLCAECGRNGIVKAATLVDHIIPHRGDRRLFWDRTNWQGLCEKCHNIKTGKGL